MKSKDLDGVCLAQLGGQGYAATQPGKLLSFSQRKAKVRRCISKKPRCLASARKPQRAWSEGLKAAHEPRSHNQCS